MSTATISLNQIVTPATPHCRHGMPFKVVAIDRHPTREAVPAGVGYPATPAVAAYTTVSALSETHPQTVGMLSMTPDGWEAA